MIIERRQTPRPPAEKTHLITTPVNKPVCTITKGLEPPPDKNGNPRAGIFLAFSPITRKIAVGKDYIQAWLKFNGAHQ